MGRKGKINQRKNYEIPAQSPLRHLANRKVLQIVIFISFLFYTLLINYILSWFTYGTFMQNVKYGSSISLTKRLFGFQIIDHPAYYGFLYGLYVIGLLIGLYVLKTSFQSLEEDFVQGTMEFDEMENLVKQYPKVIVHPFSDDEDFFEGKGGLPIARVPFEMKKSTFWELIKIRLHLQLPEKVNEYFYFLVALEPSNSIILALTRGGKDVYFIDPFLDILTRAKNIKDRPSFVYTATKGDEPRKWYQTLIKREYNVRILNTVRQYFSDPYNPLSIVFNFYKKCKELEKTNSIESDRFLAEAENEIKRSAFTFFTSKPEQKEDDFWVKSCRNLFISTGLAICDQAVREDEPMKLSGYTIYNVVNEMHAESITKENHDYLKEIAVNKEHLKQLIKKYDGKTALDVFFEELPRTHPAKKYYYAILASAPAKTTLGNVITHFDGDLEVFLSSANAKMTAFDDGFDFETIGFDSEKPTAYFIVLSQAEKSNNAIGILCLEQIYQVLEKRCTLEESGRTERDVHFVIQEAGNHGIPIPNLANKWTSSLGQGMYWHLVLQDLEQLSTLYGENTKKTIVGNTGNLVYIRSGSVETNEYIAKRLGKRSNYSRTRHKSPVGLKSTETESSERIDLLDIAELERLREGENVVLRLVHTQDNDRDPIYQYPIFNTYENDTNMIAFYKYRNFPTPKWEDIPVNNSFMEIKLEDLLWSLYPEQTKYEVNKLTIRQNQKKAAKADISVNKETEELQEDLTPAKINREEQLSLFTEEELEQAQEKHERTEQKEKDSKISSFEEVLPIGFDSKKVRDFFSDNQMRELTKIVQSHYIHRASVIREFKVICENYDMDSFLSFAVSNNEGGMTNKILLKLKDWRDEFE